MSSYFANFYLLGSQLIASYYVTLPMSKDLASFTMSRSRKLRRVVLVFISLVIIWIASRAILHNLHPSTVVRSASPYLRTLVVAGLDKYNTSWLYTHLSDWKVERFGLDNSSAQLACRKQKP